MNTNDGNYANDQKQPQDGVLPGLLQAKAANPVEPPPRHGMSGFVIHGSPAAIFGALAKAQAGFGPIERTKTVKVRSDKGNYDFAYAPLEAVLGAVTPALNANGLALLQPLVKEENQWVLRTILAHESGAYLEGSLPIPTQTAQGGSRAWQELGSAVTYARRYMVGAMLGIAPEEDDDGAAAEDMPRETQQRGPRQGTRPTPPQAPQKVVQPKTLLVPAGMTDQQARDLVASKAETEAKGTTSPGAVDSREGMVGDAPKPEGQSASSGPVASDRPLSDLLKDIGDALRGGRLNQTSDGEVKWFTKASADEFSKAAIGKPATAVNSVGDAMSLLTELAKLPASTAKQKDAYTKLRAKFGKDREQADLFCADIIGHSSDWVPSDKEADELIEALSR